MAGRVWSMRSLLAVAVIVCGSLAAPGVAAQPPPIPPLVINVRVIDSTGIPVEGADAAILVGIDESKASGISDPTGHVSLTVAQPRGDYQLVVRKIGYARSDQFFRGAPGRMSFDVVMHLATQTLAPVRVTAQEDLKRKSYFIDADEIARHADQLIDASDILKKLKPDMICGRSCFPLQAVAATTRTPVRKCPSLAFQPRRTCPVDNTPPSLSTNVWVNGVWIRSIATDTVCQTGRRGILAGVSPGSMQVLCEIRPEHIEQITYADEFDTSVGKNHSDNALFIVLKPGIAYQPGATSYVVSDSTEAASISRRRGANRDSAAVLRESMAEPRDSAAAPHDSAASLPPYRHRLLGVFDEESGDPIAGARVTDLDTGTYANTTVTGTISLVFLPEGGSLLRITKTGYEDLSVPVDIDPSAVSPLTLLMKKKSST